MLISLYVKWWYHLIEQLWRLEIMYVNYQTQCLAHSSSQQRLVLFIFPVLWNYKGFFKIIYFNWRLITLQYCGGFCHTLTWISHGCTCVPHPELPSRLPPHPIPLGHPSAPALSALSHASNLHWSSISHMVIYMFQCSSLKSSHPRLLPQSPKVCSLHLCLFCCLAYRVVVTIFLNSIYIYIYALIYCIDIFLSDLLYSV